MKLAGVILVVILAQARGPSNTPPIPEPPATPSIVPTNNATPPSAAPPPARRNIDLIAPSPFDTMGLDDASMLDIENKRRLNDRVGLVALKEDTAHIADLYHQLTVTPIGNPVAMKVLREKCKDVEGRIDRLIKFLGGQKMKPPATPEMDSLDAAIRLLETFSSLSPELLSMAKQPQVVDPKKNQKMIGDLEVVRQLVQTLQRP